MLRPLPSSGRVSPFATNHPTNVPYHYPGGSRGCACRYFPTRAAFPQMTGESASALELSRPARASLCYGPSDRSAARAAFVAGAPTQPVTQPCRLPASGPIDNYPSETLPSLMVRALGAHGQSRRFDPLPATSGLPRTTDIIRLTRLVRFVPASTFCIAEKAANVTDCGVKTWYCCRRSRQRNPVWGTVKW